MPPFTREQAIENFRKAHGDKYDYSLVEYVNSQTKIKIICPEHGVFEQKGNNHQNGQGCSKCKSEKTRKRLFDSKSSFVEKARKVHGDRYDYSLVCYSGSKSKVKIICPTHGEFEQRPGDHLNSKQGCSACFEERRGKHRRKDTNTFIKNAKRIHGNKYDYSLVEYSTSLVDVKIICSIHGVFEQPPKNHLRGSGCRKCASSARRKMSLEQILEKFKEVHGNKYDYSLVKKVGCRNELKIICPKHGIFTKMQQLHVQGFGCSRCSKNYPIMENKWLDSLNISELKRQYKIGRYRVDGYDPSTNTVYEFLGDYWHGNPKVYDPKEINTAVNKTFGYLFEKTTKRTKHLQKLGYNVIEMWESDYIN